MKIKYLIPLLLILLSIQAQSGKYSFGFVGTRFSNIGSDNKLTQIENPYGYGMIFGYAVNENINVALTGEYFKDNMKDNLGKETDYRTHLSVYYVPENFAGIRPYISAGMVYTYRSLDYTSKDGETKDVLNGRLGAGLDYNLINNIGFNVDLGFYSDGYNFVGWTSSLGLRYNF